MQRYRYGIIGTGRPHGTEGATGWGTAHWHIHGFQATDRVELVAVSDLKPDNARLFLDTYQSNAAYYPDYHEMLARENLDLVSVCTWPGVHAELTIAACDAGVRGVHCEKPMATNWGDARRMKEAADRNGTRLTLDHQRRFLEPFQRAVQIVREGQLGELQRIEGKCYNLSDWGTHWLDIFFFYNNETPAAWVMGQIDARDSYLHFGVPMENQGLCQLQWQNGVQGLLVTGKEATIGGGAEHRIIGSKGTLEVHPNAPHLRLRIGGGPLQTIETVENLHGNVAIDRGCADLVRALDEPTHKPLLSVDHAIQATEVIFATYESSRRRARVDLPLTADDNALVALLDSGALQV